MKASGLSDAESVTQAKDDLDIAGLGFVSGDTFDSVTQDFTLPTIGSDGVSISWDLVSGSGISLSGSSNKDVSVSRPDYLSGDSNVRLRATYSKNGETETEVFDLTVLKKDQVSLTASLTGSISPITITAGSDSTETLSFTGASQSLIIGTDIEVRITSRPNTAAEAHLSLNVNTGVLSPSTDIIPNDSGDYTIELSGIGNYTGTLDRTLNLTVTALSITSISYTAINTETNSALTAAAVPTVDPAEAATGALFGIDPDFTTETGLSFNTVTGAISGTATAVIDKSYTVSITGGDATKYEGSTESTSVQVSVTLSDADALAQAKADLDIAGLDFASGDTFNSVTQDFTLPISIGTDGVTISWEVVSGSGIVLSGNSNQDASVSRPDYSSGDSNVKLRATYSKNGKTETEEFDLTVLKKDQVPLTTSLTGSINPISISAGSNSTATLSFTGASQSLIIGTDIEVRIKTRPNTATEGHLSMGVGTGVLFPSTDIIPKDSGDYTIELSGIGNYTGTLDRTLNLTVTALPINSISYTTINAETSTALTAAAVPTVDPAEAAAAALFDIDTDFTAETGLSFNTGTGAISGTATAVIDKSYTVSITGGDATKYEGSTQSTNVQISVILSDADALAKAKNDLEVTGLGFADSDTWDGITQDFTLPISIGTDGVTISWEVVSGSGIVLSGSSNQDASVSRPEFSSGDTSVSLRAIYSRNGKTETEVFDLTVLKKQELSSVITNVMVTNQTVYTNSADTIDITISDISGLIYGTDYSVSFSASGVLDAAKLTYNASTGTIDVANTLDNAELGTHLVTVTVAGNKNYSGTVSTTFDLTVELPSIESVTIMTLREDTQQFAPVPDTIHPAYGDSYSIDAQVTVKGQLAEDVTWSSSAPSIVKIESEASGNGATITMLAPGNAIVTATSTADNSKSDTINIEVQKKSLKNGNIAYTELIIDAGATSGNTAAPVISNTDFLVGTEVLTDAVEFTMSLESGTGPVPGTYLTIDSNTGIITVDPQQPAFTVTTYLVKMNGKGNYTGNWETPVIITVNAVTEYTSPGAITFRSNNQQLELEWDEFDNDDTTLYTVYAYNLTIRIDTGDTAPDIDTFLAGKFSITEIIGVMTPIHSWMDLDTPTAAYETLANLGLIAGHKYIFVVTGSRNAALVTSTLAAGITDLPEDGAPARSYYVGISADKSTAYTVVVNNAATYTWNQASAEAGGYSVNVKLVEIQSADEQALVEGVIQQIDIQTVNVASDGGGGRYLWIGASDRGLEGGWRWENTGIEIGVMDNGVWTGTNYHNWGQAIWGQQIEPDDWQDQDYGAIGLTPWPNGSVGQWNDIDGPCNGYIMELPRDW